MRLYLSYICLFLCLLASQNSPAPPPATTPPPIDIACDVTTDYTLANLNEIKTKGGATTPTVEFVEVKILVDNTNISGWEVCFSDNPTKETCIAMGAGNGTWYTTTQTGGLADNASTHSMGSTFFDANTWITYDAPNVKADAGEVLLRSSVGAESGNVVLDYIRYDNSTGICGDGNERWNITDDDGGSALDITVLSAEPDDYTACSACFESRDPAQKDFGRTEPDGTGDWDNNGDTPTEGSTNDTGGVSGGFNISVFSPGSTCSTDATTLGLALRELVIIEAINNGGNTITNFNGTINLTTINNHGNWYTTDGIGASTDLALGTLTDIASDDDGVASYIFDSTDGGFVALYLDNQHAETLTISVVDASDVGTLSTSTNLTFSDNVFVVNVNEPDPPFNTSPNDLTPVAGRDHQFQIQMMRRDTSLTPNDCGVALGYNVSDIKAWITRDTDDPGGATPSLTTVSETEALTSTEPGAVNLTLAFASGSADFSLITTDVGKYTLEFKDDTNSFADIDIVSDSITLTVRPFGFDIDTSNLRSDDWTDNSTLDDSTGVNLTYAADENGSIFAKAGEDFTVTVTAVQWESGDDSGDDGVPDTGANLTDNLATNSFGNEGTPATVDITHAVTLPTPTPDTGTLTGGASITGFTNGAANVTLSFDEVGIIELSAGHSNYLGSTVSITGAAPNYGRFTPYVFDVSVNSPAPEFGVACGSFGYIGQSFTYNDPPVFAVIAYAKGVAPAFGPVTENYTGNFTGNFFKFTDAKFQADGGKTYSAFLGTLDTSLVPSPDPVIADTGNGTATLTFSDGGGIAFNRGDPEGPFDADIALSINVLDEDDVFAGDGNGANLNPLSFGAATDGNGINFSVSNEQRWGRLVLDNAFGSELLPLEISVRTEYQSSGDFITNADDSCTAYTSVNITYTNLTGLTANPVAAGVGTLVNGIVDDANPLILTNTLNEVGFVDVTHSIDFWLQYDWDDTDDLGDGPYDDNPTSRATWGIYKGSKEIIYIREPWN